MLPERPDADRTRARYVDLLRRSLLGYTSFDNELRILYLRRCLRGLAQFDERTLHAIRAWDPAAAEKLASTLAAGFPIGTDLGELPFSSTMLGEERLRNVQRCVRTIVTERIDGD